MYICSFANICPYHYNVRIDVIVFDSLITYFGKTHCWYTGHFFLTDPSFCEETDAQVPPSFVNQQGIHDGNGQHNFSGPPPAIMPIFENGPPHLRGGPPGILAL